MLTKQTVGSCLQPFTSVANIYIFKRDRSYTGYGNIKEEKKTDKRNLSRSFKIFMDTIIKTQRVYIVKVLLEAKLTIWQTSISYLVDDLAALVLCVSRL